MLSEEAARDQAGILTDIALKNLQALVGPILNPINDYGDRHPEFERGFIVDPGVVSVGFDAEKGHLLRFKVIWKERGEEVVTTVSPINPKGVAEWHCTCESEDLCYHVAFGVLVWRKSCKEEAKNGR